MDGILQHCLKPVVMLNIVVPLCCLLVSHALDFVLPVQDLFPLIQGRIQLEDYGRGSSRRVMGVPVAVIAQAKGIAPKTHKSSCSSV